MTGLILRWMLALGLAAGLALMAADGADAKSRRAVYKKPIHHARVVRPAVEPSYVREPECVTRYDSSRSPVPAHFYCESAFRRLYPPR